MKSKKLALTVITLALSSFAAFPPVVQGADSYETTRARQCRDINDTHTQYGLPTTDCAAFEKSTSGVMGPVRAMPDESMAIKQCREGNDLRVQWGLPTLQC